ncbi:unnamed protein product, partial [marine sediment metagenome]
HSDCIITEFDEFGKVKNVRVEKAKPVKIMQPELQWKKTALPPDKIEIAYEAAIPDRINSDGNIITGLLAAEEKVISLSELADRTAKPVAIKIRESMDGIISEIIGTENQLPNFKDFFENMKDKFHNQPQVFIKQLQNQFKDQPLISRYLVATFPSEESFRAIYDKKGYLTDLLLRHGNDWQVILAKIAVKAEAQKKLKSRINLRGKQKAVKEMKEFYRKYLPNLRTAHIFQYAKGKIKEPKNLDKMLQNVAHLLYEEILKENK